MPSVNSSGIIAVSSEYISIIRGQQASHTISLHKNFVGNAINIGAITEVVAEYVNTDNQIFKTESKTANTLVFGAANGDTQNQISISLTAAETAALPLNDNNVNGECWVRLKVTEGISEVVLPILKIGNVYDAGDQIGDIVASRYGVPSTVYSVAGANNTYFANNNPSQGQIIFNAALPSQVTKFKIALKDDKGVRNKYFENLLEERLDVDGLRSNIFFTNTRNNSEYSVFRLVSYVRINILDADPLAPNNSDDDDALEGLWKKQFSLAEIVAADQFKTYDELKKRLENVLRVASSRPSDPEVFEEETTRGSVRELEDLSEGLGSRTKEPVSLASDEDDDALSYFAKLAES